MYNTSYSDYSNPGSYHRQHHQNRPKRNSNTFTIKEPYFTQIFKEKKTVEGRINSGAFYRIRAGEKITFINNHSRSGATEVTCTIKAKIIYKNFRDMLEQEGVEKCLPGIKSLDQGTRVYESIPSFKARAAKNGVVALRLKIDKPRAEKRERPVEEKVEGKAKERKERKRSSYSHHSRLDKDGKYRKNRRSYGDKHRKDKA